MIEIRSCSRVEDDSWLFNMGRDLFEQFEPLAPERGLKIADPGGVAARMGEALHEPLSFRVNNLCKHNRYGSCPLQNSSQNGSGACNDQVDVRFDQLSGVLFYPLAVSRRKPIVNLKIVTNRPSDRREPSLKRSCDSPCFWITLDQGHHHPDAPHSLLRAGVQWPCGRRPTKQRDEVALAQVDHGRSPTVRYVPTLPGTAGRCLRNGSIFPCGKRAFSCRELPFSSSHGVRRSVAYRAVIAACAAWR